MTEGFIADKTFGGVAPSDWIEGAPVKSFWSGTKTKNKKQYLVSTFRCADCGFLESYAAEVKEPSLLDTFEM